MEKNNVLPAYTGRGNCIHGLYFSTIVVRVFRMKPVRPMLITNLGESLQWMTLIKNLS
jgi:hypothetical protein